MAETARNTELIPPVDDLAQITDRRRIEDNRSWIERWIDTHKLNYTAAARQLGLGDAWRTPLGRFIEGRLENDPTRLLLAIEQYRATIEGPDDGISELITFRVTRCVDQIWEQAREAREGHKMSAVIGFTGAGKTEALKQFQRRNSRDNQPPIRHLTCNILVNAPFLARKLARDMGLVEKGGEPAMCLELVTKRLRSHPEFWIVDEANFLQERCLHVLRYLHDTTGTGILMAGTPVFLSMVGNRSRGTPSASPLYQGGEERGSAPDGPLALFADRVFSRVVGGVMEDEITEIAEDVLKGKFSEQALSKLILYVNHNMRLLTRLLIALREYRKKSGQRQIDEKMVEGAWAKLQHTGVQ